MVGANSTNFVVFYLGIGHIIAILSDGAAVMELLKAVLEIEQQLCLAHGNHLGVMSVVSKNKKASEAFVDNNQIVAEVEDESNLSDSENGEDHENYPEVDFIEGEEELELIDAIKDLIDRVRWHVNHINGSPVLSWQLQQYVKEWQILNDKKIEELVSLIYCISTCQSLSDKY